VIEAAGYESFSTNFVSLGWATSGNSETDDFGTIAVTPERRSTEGEILQHITGEWTVNKRADGFRFDQIVISPDGSLAGVLSDGSREGIGIWKFDRRILVVDWMQTNYARLADGQVVSLGNVSYYPVVFANEHELIVTPGISMAGRYRFTR
jgi:hypothetical protein